VIDGFTKTGLVDVAKRMKMPRLANLPPQTMTETDFEIENG